MRCGLFERFSNHWTNAEQKVPIKEMDIDFLTAIKGKMIKVQSVDD